MFAVAFLATSYPMPGTMELRIEVNGPRNGIANTFPRVSVSCPLPRMVRGSSLWIVKEYEP